MGCGLITARGSNCVVHHPISLNQHNRAAGSSRAVDEDEMGVPPSTSGRRSGSGLMSGGHAGFGSMTAGGALSSSDRGAFGGDRGDRDGSRGDGRDGRDGDGHDAAASGAGQPHHGSRLSVGRRFILGERVVLASRLPGYTQDHAFCFECGAFFQLTNARQPQCTRCGSSFVQFLRGAGSTHWVDSATTTGVNFTFDNQLEATVTTSLTETPMTKRPTQESFLRSLPVIVVSDSDMQLREKLDPADQRCYCAICRDGFAIGDRQRRLPCNHSFHEDCIMPWLQGNNTCPSCRCKLPEAKDDDENDEDPEVMRLKHTRSAPEALMQQHSGQQASGTQREGHIGPRLSSTSHSSRGSNRGDVQALSSSPSGENQRPRSADRFGASVPSQPQSMYSHQQAIGSSVVPSTAAQP